MFLSSVCPAAPLICHGARIQVYLLSPHFARPTACDPEILSSIFSAAFQLLSAPPFLYAPVHHYFCITKSTLGNPTRMLRLFPLALVAGLLTAVSCTITFKNPPDRDDVAYTEGDQVDLEWTIPPQGQPISIALIQINSTTGDMLLPIKWIFGTNPPFFWIRYLRSAHAILY